MVEVVVAEVQVAVVVEEEEVDDLPHLLHLSVTQVHLRLKVQL